MLARLWWKEWRSLAPIMATLIVAAGGIQWLLLFYGGREIRNGVLLLIAMGWSVLYALVAGSSSFAGEREHRTIGLLDALPVGRGILWVSKVSFTLITSLGLAILLFLLGLSGWDVNVRPLPPMTQPALLFLMLLAEATVWGLFWSAWMKSAISAAIFAVLTTIASTSLGSVLNADSQPMNQFGVIRLVGQDAPWRIGFMAVGLFLSWLAVDEQFRLKLRAEWKAGRPLAAIGPSRAQVIPSVRDTLPVARPPSPLLPSPAFRSVVWQTIREGRSTWLQTTLIAACLLGINFFSGTRVVSGEVLTMLFCLALLVQGVSIFGLENTLGTRQFLDNMAVSPRIVWVAKVLTWVWAILAFLGMCLVGLIASMVARPGVVALPGIRNNTDLVIFPAMIANILAVAMIGGMMFTRRITATMISLMAAILVIVPQVVLIVPRMISAWSLIASPLVLFIASRLWAGDWLANRGGFRRWVKLAGLIAVPYVGLLLIYVAGRAWGVPDIGPQVDRTAMNRTASPLAQAYWRANEALVIGGNTTDLKETLDRGWKSASPDIILYWKHNQAAIELARAAAIQPGMVKAVDPPVWSSAVNATPPIDIARSNLHPLLALDGLERRSRGDFAGAWVDILAQFQMSDQYASGASSIWEYRADLAIAQSATDQAIAWARDPKVSVADLRSAQASLKQVATVPTTLNVTRSESIRTERSLDLSTGWWVDWMSPSKMTEDPFLPFTRIFNTWVIAPVWERERTRRIARLATASAIQNAGLDRPHRTYLPGGVPGDPMVRTPLAEQVVPKYVLTDDWYDREETNRRALKIYLALRAWQFTHDGKAPETLQELIPSELDELPVDPYSRTGSTFPYFFALRAPDRLSSGGDERPAEEEAASATLQFWIASVGPDGASGVRGSSLDIYTTDDPKKRGGDDINFILPANPPERKP